MREILFRGKRKDNGEWIQGCYLEYNNWQGIKFYHIVNPETGESLEVHPSTVGQYTGLKDQNGKKIFEGDILYSSYQDKVEPTGIGHIYNEVAFKDGAFGWIGEITNDFFPFGGSEINETIIGNIHDNIDCIK